MTSFGYSRRPALNCFPRGWVWVGIAATSFLGPLKDRFVITGFGTPMMWQRTFDQYALVEYHKHVKEAQRAKILRQRMMRRAQKPNRFK